MSEPGTQADSFILFQLAGATYAVPSHLVRHVEMLEGVTPVPNAPPFVEGIVFSRGQVIPALNLRRRFGFEPAPVDTRTRLLVVGSGGRTVGFIVDTAREFMSIPSDSIQAPPAEIAGLSARYISGIALMGERPVLILDVAEVLNVTDTRLPAGSPAAD